MQIYELTRAIEQWKAEVAELQVPLKRAGDDREKQYKEFQITAADYRATQKLLAAALNILKGSYEKVSFKKAKRMIKDLILKFKFEKESNEEAEHKVLQGWRTLKDGFASLLDMASFSVQFVGA